MCGGQWVESSRQTNRAKYAFFAFDICFFLYLTFNPTGKNIKRKVLIDLWDLRFLHLYNFYHLWLLSICFISTLFIFFFFHILYFGNLCQLQFFSSILWIQVSWIFCIFCLFLFFLISKFYILCNFCLFFCFSHFAISVLFCIAKLSSSWPVPVKSNLNWVLMVWKAKLVFCLLTWYDLTSYHVQFTKPNIPNFFLGD